MPEADFVMRPYRRGDAKAMYQLDCVCFDERFRFSLRTMRRLAEASGAVTILAEDAGKLAGFVMAHMEPDGVYLSTLDVAPGWRRLGLAGRLLDAVEAEALLHPTRSVWLHVFMENDAAIRLYESRGYGRIERVVNHYGRGLDGFVYRKQS